MDIDLNYCPIYSNEVFKLVAMLPFIILCIPKEQNVSKAGVSRWVEIQYFSGPAGELTTLPDP